MSDIKSYPFRKLDLFTHFVIERHRIWERRSKGQSAPWTTDEILATYRFCNVYRELDRTTQWIARRWRGPLVREKNVWFAMVIARLINHPPTLEKFKTPHVWDREKFLSTIEKLKTFGEKIYGAAYIVSTNGIAQEKAEYLADMVIQPLWDNRDTIRPKEGERLKNFFNRLMFYQGMGSFIAAQVVADVKYVPPLMNSAPDWWTFAASGPGSRRGMSYLLGLDPRTPWREHEWKDALTELSIVTCPIFEEANLPRIHNQDLQNCLCEFSKYRRTMLGTGRPKQKFTPYEMENR